MPRDLFGDVSDPSVRVSAHSRYTVPISCAAHAVIVAALVAVPILAPAVLPQLRGSDLVYAEVYVPPPPPPPPAPRVVEPSAPPPDPSAAPVTAPDSILPEPERLPDMTVPSTADVGIVGVTGDIETVITAAPPAPPAPPQGPVRPGGQVRTPAKVHDVAPVYPAIAQAARVEGLVVLEAIIDTDGRVRSVAVLKSVPLLDAAAQEAVRQWVYTPTLLNGVPVPVVMTVTVMFRLN